ncbi:MAG: hypothetical protein WCK08_10165, partial [Betaproteobacteria bacterium]
ANVTLGQVSATNVSVVADTGAIVNAAGSTKNVSATKLRLTADDAIGSELNHLTTNVATLSAMSTGTDTAGIYLTQDGALTVDSVTVTVTHFNADASSSTVTDASQADLVTGHNGNIVLISKSGSITLNDGADADGQAISAQGSGTIVIETQGNGTNVTATANIVSTSGDISVLAAGSVNLTQAVMISTSAPVIVRATEGDLIMPDAQIFAGSSPVTVSAGAGMQPGIVSTSGKVDVQVSATGEVVFNREMDRGDQDINVVANSVEISAKLLGTGGKLTVNTLPPQTPTSSPAAIHIGGVPSATDAELHLSLDEIGLIQDGFSLIEFGTSSQTNQSIVIDGSNATGQSQPVVFNDPLLLDISGTGGHLHMLGQIRGDTLVIMGSSHTTTLTSNDLAMKGSILVADSILVQSGSMITAGTGGLGDLTITGNISGLLSGEGLNQDLSLSAIGGNVRLERAIKDLDDLTITSAIDVSFGESVAIYGNLVINATGDVTFSNTLTLGSAGELVIKGAKSVTFANGVTVGGDVSIDAQALKFMGGAGSFNSTQAGSTLAITAAGSSQEAGSYDVWVGGYDANTLSLTTADIAAIGSNFGHLLIGEVGFGRIVVAGNTDFRTVGLGGDNTVPVAIELKGESIVLNSGLAASAIQVPGALSLNASGNVWLYSGINTATTSPLSLSRGQGSITMAQGSRLDSRGGDVSVVGASVDVGTINAWSPDLTVGGVVKIDAGRGTVSDANKDNAADIFAKAISLNGYGPATTSPGNVLEVVTELVQVSVPEGVVVRETGANGRTSFNAMNAGKLYRQLVVEGSNAVRVTQDPAAVLSLPDAQRISAGIPSYSSLLAHPGPAPTVPTVSTVPTLLTQPTLSAQPTLAAQFFSDSAVSRYLAPVPAAAALRGDLVLTGANPGVHGGADDLLSDTSYGLSPQMQQSFILGTPGEQPFISGLNSFSQDDFEFWLDPLSV